MNVTGPNTTFHQMSAFQPGAMPGAQSTPQHATSAGTPVPTAMPQAGPSYLPVSGASFFSAGYFALAPQMAVYGGAQGYASGAGAQPMMAPGISPSMVSDPAAGSQFAAGAVSQSAGGHVTANATNALSSQAPAGGMSPMGASALGIANGFGMSASAFGMAGMMAMPVGFVIAQPVILMPVFFAIAGQAPMGGQMPQAGEQPAAVPAAAVPEPAVPEPAAPVPEVVTQEPVSPVAPSGDEQVVPSVDEADPETAGVKPGDRAVVEVAAEEFARFRKRELNAELATSLILELTTSEGDSVRLDFSQLDVLERSSFKGMTEDGERSRSRSSEESSERLVNMSVDGELNAEEKASIDAVLKEVIDVANKFFNNDLSAAVSKLETMEFDMATLADFSLKMSMSRSVEYSKTVGGSELPEQSALDGLKRLADRDGEISKVIEFFASEQRRLIDSASEVLDRPSAVKMVKSLLPPMLEDPFAKLSEKLQDAFVAEVEEPESVSESELDDASEADV